MDGKSFAAQGITISLPCRHVTTRGGAVEIGAVLRAALRTVRQGFSTRSRPDHLISRMERAGLLEGDCSVATFIEDFARLRGRPIALVEFSPDSPPPLTGLWLRHPDADVVLAASPYPWMRQHILLHEVGHIYFGHGQDSDTRLSGLIEQWGEILSGGDLPNATPIQPEEIAGARVRAGYTDANEVAAELFADEVLMILARKNNGPGRDPVLQSVTDA
ncbi:hypothetical protein [Nocardia terpenica]|uniref:IrrE N-terminal-like domain-containing protein n=1 Tax=Nocardia terpenica TaxID=455432 RepID=A0A6G9ZDH0_9NOCA|nr:hypothetical protein [Nocardia terpenica]QIS23588.1 hypothetical protein F6W96_40315 [Nocardia terpenica]